MTKQNMYQKELKEFAKSKNFDSKLANFSFGQHKMLKEENYRSFYEKDRKFLKKELSLLEKVDLLDYWKFDEYGTGYKKR